MPGARLISRRLAYGGSYLQVEQTKRIPPVFKWTRTMRGLKLLVSDICSKHSTASSLPAKL